MILPHEEDVCQLPALDDVLETSPCSSMDLDTERQVNALLFLADFTFKRDFQLNHNMSNGRWSRLRTKGHWQQFRLGILIADYQYDCVGCAESKRSVMAHTVRYDML